MGFGVFLVIQLLCTLTTALMKPHISAGENGRVPVAVQPFLSAGYEYLGNRPEYLGVIHILLKRMPVSQLQAKQSCESELLPYGSLHDVYNQTQLNFLNDLLPLDFCWVQGSHRPSLSDFMVTYDYVTGEPITQDFEEDGSMDFGLTVSTYNKVTGGKLSIRPATEEHCFICSLYVEDLNTNTYVVPSNIYGS